MDRSGIPIRPKEHPHISQGPVTKSQQDSGKTTHIKNREETISDQKPHFTKESSIIPKMRDHFACYKQLHYVTGILGFGCDAPRHDLVKHCLAYQDVNPSHKASKRPVTKSDFLVLFADASVGRVLGGCCKNNFRQQFKDKLSYNMNEI